jgi:glycosyltransferase involved in cell wall biosynthesis
MNPSRVIIVQQYLTHYRVPFFRCLHDNCAEAGVDLKVLYGKDGGRHLAVDIPDWCIPTRVTRFGGMTWQHVWKLTQSADLVIVEQAVKHLVNYAFLGRRLVTPQKVAFWGHGRNFQSRKPNSTQERVKRFISRHVDWWFAYNDLSASVVRELGFPADRITSVQNAIDTKALQSARDALDPRTLANLKAELGIASENVAVYTGGLYNEKRISFLLEAASLIRASISDFHLVIIGQGPDEDIVRRASQQYYWIHHMGPKNDVDKVPYWAISKVFLMPGLVGLAVLDSFALGVPMVTTAYPYHSPEIDYLRNEKNGVMVGSWENPAEYATAVVDLLCDDTRRLQLIAAGKVDASLYTVENMAERFAGGIRSVLNAEKCEG